ncbi:MAG: hypothetical protein LBC53_10865 [Spirochaetaceae bacterium]|nr:hypothetical protein [Spirochaetaceae bacterium]
MDLTAIITGSVSVISIFVGLPAIILNFVSKSQKNKLETLKLQKELLELEIENQDKQLKLLEAENKKYDVLLTAPVASSNQD